MLHVLCIMELNIYKPSNRFDEIAEVLKDIADESSQFSFTSDDLDISNDFVKSFSSALNNIENSIFVIGEYEGKIVGFAYLEGGKRQRTFHCANLGIGILKNYRGKKFGDSLLKFLIDYAKSTDYIAKINLQVIKENSSAIKLYKNNGFIVEGISKRELFFEDKFYDYVNMGLLID